MNQKKITCIFNLFDATQTIVATNPITGNYDTYSIATNDLSQTLVNLCESLDSYEVFLDAPKDYALKKIIPEVDAYLANTYSDKKINFILKGE